MRSENAPCSIAVMVSVVVMLKLVISCKPAGTTLTGYVSCCKDSNLPVMMTVIVVSPSEVVPDVSVVFVVDAVLVMSVVSVVVIELVIDEKMAVAELCPSEVTKAVEDTVIEVMLLKEGLLGGEI